MRGDYPESAKLTEEFLLHDDLEEDELKYLRRRIEDLLRKNRKALFVAAAVLADHDFLEIS